MKREIKFRGKRLDNNEWIYGYLVIDPIGRYRIYWKPFDDALSNTYHFVDHVTVGQYTILQDHNNVEIYEGDIVEYDNGTIAKVVYRMGAFCGHDIEKVPEDEAYLLLISEDSLLEDTPLDFYAEVIGNIHDNPEFINS